MAAIPPLAYREVEPLQAHRVANRVLQGSVAVTRDACRLPTAAALYLRQR